MDTYLLKKSNRKGKRFVIIMEDMKHHFGSDVGKTYIDHGDLKKKEAWIARHKNDKGYNNKHSGIYYYYFDVPLHELQLHHLLLFYHNQNTQNSTRF